MTPQQLDRWLLNVIFKRSRVFKVKLSDCCDEFGNGFGVDGSHFFVCALAQGINEEAVCDHLRSYYAAHSIHSFNEIVGHDIGDPAGDQYFCPWESNRVRPLSNFAESHMAGPTTDEALIWITQRLLTVLAMIQAQGFRQFSILEGFLRVIAVVDRHGRQRFIMRDGQHRAAALSHLGYETLWACYDADHWTPSLTYRLLSRAPGNFRPENLAPRLVREDAVDEWPHVREGRVTREEALTYFHAMFGDLKIAAE